MITEVQSLEEVIKLIRENEKRLKGMGVLSLSIFGSFAEGNFNNKSDVDILIEPEYEKPFTLFTLIRVKLFLEELLGRKVDIRTKNSLKDEVRKNIKEVKVF